MNDKKVLTELNGFLGKAALNTYAGGGREVDPEDPGFTELEYKDGFWSYKDSYTGFFQSWGREVVWYKNKPFWSQIYGGGMTESFQADVDFAHKTFDFLKKALSAGEKQLYFQPRGPRKFTSNLWEYFCDWHGDISRFSGGERIVFKKKTVFSHDFLGGLVLSR